MENNLRKYTFGIKHHFIYLKENIKLPIRNLFEYKSDAISSLVLEIIDILIILLFGKILIGQFGDVIG